jgi:hypothetical protein
MYKAVKNCEWIDAEHSRIKCEVNFDHVDFEEWTPFCADPMDQYAPYCKEIFDKAKAGDFGEIKEYIAPPVLKKVNFDEIPVVDISPKVIKKEISSDI